ncbi:hypothetical protein [Rhodococcus kronopolitis]|uniref:DUF2207 domain-containing protein n=1 Tax=Rhodococcus kronopolitis TaxID=1460226 RepID=A0ABV9FMP7_9NOCA
MLVLTLALAAVGFLLLVVSLLTGSVVWAWGCIVVCVVGAVLLLVSSLRSNTVANGDAAGGGSHRSPPSGSRRTLPTERFDESD